MRWEIKKSNNSSYNLSQLNLNGMGKKEQHVYNFFFINEDQNK